VSSIDWIFSDHSAFICHLDMDCFFVSIGLRMRPDLVGKPVAITHSRVVILKEKQPASYFL
jgi:nucleotidyltransferase/DNA polymerase involved in DNA repair